MMSVQSFFYSLFEIASQCKKINSKRMKQVMGNKWKTYC